MHDHDVRNLEFTEESSYEAERSLQAILYVDGRRSRSPQSYSAEPGLQYRITRGVLAVCALGFSFAIGFFAFRFFGPHGGGAHKHHVIALNTLAHNEAHQPLVAAYLETAPPLVSAPHSAFLPPVAVAPVEARSTPHAATVPRINTKKPPEIKRVVEHRVVVKKPVVNTQHRNATVMPTASVRAAAKVATVSKTAAPVPQHRVAMQQPKSVAQMPLLHAPIKPAAQLKQEPKIRIHAASPKTLAARNAVVYQPTTAKYALHTKRIINAVPAIASLYAVPNTIPAGSGSTICVSAKHASLLSLSSLGAMNPNGLSCRRVAPLTTTTYTAWAGNSQGETASALVTVTVAP